jgi:hypothetical protein
MSAISRRQTMTKFRDKHLAQQLKQQCDNSLNKALNK